jgi:D-alanine-D-alanine ligase
MSSRLRIATIFGGRSGEHEVSLMSAQSVLENLDPAKYEVLEIGITKKGKWVSGPSTLQAFKDQEFESLVPVTFLADPTLGKKVFKVLPDRKPESIFDVQVVFPILHGSFGEDGTLQGLLEMVGIPYVGAGVLASSVAMDKGLFKELMKATGVPTIPYKLFTQAQLSENLDTVLGEAEAIAPYPLFTKPANMGSSVGISKCMSRGDLIEGLMEAAQYDRRVLVEQGIDAREIEVSVLGNEHPEASIPGEIIPGEEFYSYRAKYQDAGSELKIPAELDESTCERVQSLALLAYRAMDGAGMARVDFLVDRKSGSIFLNEINTIPGFTQISMYPKLWEASGLKYNRLLDRLVELALERQAQKDMLLRIYRSH